MVAIREVTGSATSKKNIRVSYKERLRDLLLNASNTRRLIRSVGLRVKCLK